jgi:EpsD family peptidyl-prolyl cis-trans isomerase
VLAGCSGKEATAPAGQVVATVNKREISVHQLNFALQRRTDLAPLGEAARARALDDLITQEVLVQAALDAKLERDPNILLALEAARRDVLARAYLERTTTSAGKPSADEVSRMYAERPALFKARRIYQLLEHDVEIADDKLPAFEARIDTLKTPQAVAQFISESGLRYQSAPATRVPEALPMEVADKLASLTDGQTLLVKQPKGVRAMTVVSTMPAPVPEAQARPAIEAYLANRERMAAAEAQVKMLRGKAVVERSAALEPAAAASAQAN